MAFGVPNYPRRAALLAFAPNHLQIIALAKDPGECLAQQPVFEQEEDTYATMSGCVSFSAVGRRLVQTRATVPGDLHVESFRSANAFHSYLTLALPRKPAARPCVVFFTESLETWAPDSKLRSISWHCKRQGATSRLTRPKCRCFSSLAHGQPGEVPPPVIPGMTNHFTRPPSGSSGARPSGLLEGNRCLPQARGPHGSALGGVSALTAGSHFLAFTLRSQLGIGIRLSLEAGKRKTPNTCRRDQLS